jgi:hypothetical protein
MSRAYTVEQLAAMLFRAGTFGDGARGMAFQERIAVDEPRFGHVWRRENHRDPGRTYFSVDGNEVKDLAEAVAKLALPPDPESPHELMKRLVAEWKAEDEARAAKVAP